MASAEPVPPRRSTRRFRAKEYLVILAGLAVLLALTFPAYTFSSARLFTHPWLDGHSSEFALYPWDRFVAASLASGVVPLWNPYEAGGNPLVANYQSSLFYPLKVLVYFLDALDFYLLVRLAVAGVFMYRFLRFVRLSRAAAALGTLSFTLSSHFLLFLNLTHVNAEVLIPLVLFTTAAYIRYGGAGWFLAAALSVTLVVFGGHPEATFYVLLFGGGFSVYEGWVAGKGVRAIPPRRRYLAGGAIFLAGVAMGAVQLLPFLEYLPRAWHIHASGVGGIHRDALGFVEFVVPRIRPEGYDFPMGVGSAALLFAVYAVSEIRRLRARAVYFTLIPLGFVGLYLGVWPFSELGRLPLIGEAGNIKYPAPIVNASLAVLAAIGHDRLRGKLDRGDPCRSFFWVGGGLVVLGLLVPGGLVAFGSLTLDLGAAALSAGLVTGCLLFVRLRQRGRLEARGLTLAILGSVLAGLWANHAGIGGSAGWVVAAVAILAPLGAFLGDLVPGRLGSGLKTASVLGVAVAVTLVHVGTARVVGPPDGQRDLPDPDRPPDFVSQLIRDNETRGAGPFRITGEPTALPANQATVYGVEDVRAFDALYVDRFFQYLNVINDLPDYRKVLFPLPARISQEEALARLLASGSDWLYFEQTKRSSIKVDKFSHPLVDLLGVRYFLYGPYYKGPVLEGEGYRTIYEGYGFHVVANDRALPRAFLVHSAEVFDSRDAVTRRLGEPGFDGRSTVLLEEPPPGPLRGDGAQDQDESVSVVSRGIHHVHVKVVAKAPAILVVTENYYPGWEAERGGAGGDPVPVKILAGDLAFRGVYVPAGRSEVRFTYRPRSVIYGAALGVLVLAGLVLAALRRPAARWLGRRDRESGPSIGNAE